ncbi:MAG TPA: TonB-dependent receptor [Caulobacteraceae bacterium]
MTFTHRLLCAASATAIIMSASAASAEVRQYDIPSQALGDALARFGAQSDVSVVTTSEITRTKTSQAFSGEAEPEVALAQLLAGTGLTWKRDGETFLIVRANGPQSGSAAGGGAEVEALIVTAQKREEDIQDVPIAISAFTQEALDAQKIEGGFDLLKAIPNVTFSKNNFTSYNFSIRGIGTKAISATTDPGVAVAFNSTGLIRNRLFEQEYFDIERVEVLRGPQGTLYGRNATAGVINVISAKPDMDEFKGWVKGEVGNYDTKRLSAMVNVPLIEDKLAVRISGAATDRQGYDFNSVTNHAVNGRNLWSARLTLAFKPTDRFRSNLIWERFEEDDDRSRTGKQLCHHHDGYTQLGSEAISGFWASVYTSQGCVPGSLYDEGAFGTPNGLAIPFVAYAAIPGLVGGTIGYTEENWWEGDVVTALQPVDPYGGVDQSHDMRVIASFRDPVYRANTDVLELNWDLDLTDTLTLTGQTAYVKDQIYSFQDFNRFNTVPVFPDTSNLWDGGVFGTNGPSPLRELLRGGVYCDPQLGCSDTMAGFDISQSRSTQFSQELRIASDFDGPVNFSAGLNYTRYKTLEDYYIFFNIVTLVTQLPGGLYPTQPFNATADYTKCGNGGANYTPLSTPVDMDSDYGRENCIYIDPNPIESINGEGHNYYRSQNPYKVRSAAAFGELYWQVREDLRVTAGLRYTDDHKTFTPIPSQVLLGTNNLLGGKVNRGYYADPDIKQKWGEFTGRLGIDWKPVVPFTDQTMVYAFYSRGYKGGGANPPGIGFSGEEFCLFDVYCIPPIEDYGTYGSPGDPGNRPIVQTLPYPKVFEPEFVNAFELGTKNTLLGGAAQINVATYFYDYSNYQVSQIKDRTAVNENFDAKAWGIEIESLFHPTEDLHINFALGYADTEIADGEQSIDIMDRTAGNPDYMIAKPFILQPSNCIAPIAVAEKGIEYGRSVGQPNPEAFLGSLCPNNFLSELLIPLFFGDIWSAAGVDRVQYLKDTNGGAGFYKELGGNELPNAPHWTVSLGAQYAWHFQPGWTATLRGDGYWQAQSWARVYNLDPYDKLHGWYNANLSLWVENDEGLKIELYAKNLLDKTPITDAFLNSDDTALTTNVFVLDPRLIGLSIRKEF